MCVGSWKVRVMNSTASAPCVDQDTPEEIAEMFAEAARVDALFQSGAISTCLPLIFPTSFFAPDRSLAAERSPAIRPSATNSLVAAYDRS
jgi:hypothetical protein